MAVTAEPLDPEAEAPLAVLTADTLAAIDQLRADAGAAAEAQPRPVARARLTRPGDVAPSLNSGPTLLKYEVG